MRKWVCQRNLLASHKKEMPQKEVIQIKYSGHICAYVAKKFCEHAHTCVWFLCVRPWLYFDGSTASYMRRIQTQCVYRNMGGGLKRRVNVFCLVQYTLVCTHAWVFAFKYLHDILLGAASEDYKIVCLLQKKILLKSVC